MASSCRHSDDAGLRCRMCKGSQIILNLFFDVFEMVTTVKVYISVVFTSDRCVEHLDVHAYHSFAT